MCYIVWCTAGLIFNPSQPLPTKLLLALLNMTYHDYHDSRIYPNVSARHRNPTILDINVVKTNYPYVLLRTIRNNN